MAACAVLPGCPLEFRGMHKPLRAQHAIAAVAEGTAAEASDAGDAIRRSFKPGLRGLRCAARPADHGPSLRDLGPVAAPGVRSGSRTRAARTTRGCNAATSRRKKARLSAALRSGSQEERRMERTAIQLGTRPRGRIDPGQTRWLARSRASSWRFAAWNASRSATPGSSSCSRLTTKERLWRATSRRTLKRRRS